MNPGAFIAVGAWGILVGLAGYGLACDARRWLDDRRSARHVRQMGKATKVTVAAPALSWEAQSDWLVDDVLETSSGHRVPVHCMDSPRRVPSYQLCKETWALPSATNCPAEELL